MSISVQSQEVKEKDDAVLTQAFIEPLVLRGTLEEGLDSVKDPSVQQGGITPGKVLLLSCIHEGLNVPTFRPWYGGERQEVDTLKT